MAVTANRNERPTAADVGAVTRKCVVVAGATTIVEVVPAIPEFAVSVARGARAFKDPAGKKPLTEMDRMAELQGLADDIEKLGRDRAE